MSRPLRPARLAAVVISIWGQQLVSTPRTRTASQPRNLLGTIKAFDIGLGPRQFRGVASTGVVDRMQDIVVPEGGDVTQFRRNPILLYQHDSAQPIGTVPSIALRGGQWEFLAQFADEGVSEKADEACRLVKTGVLSALSIGFLPERIERIPDSYGVRYTKWSLLELSVVSVPACPDALITQRSLSRGTPDAELLQRARAAQHRLAAPAGRGGPRALPSSRPEAHTKGEMFDRAQELRKKHGRHPGNASAALMQMETFLRMAYW